MEQTLTPEQRREINKARDAAPAVKPMGIQYEKDANSKAQRKQKLNKTLNEAHAAKYKTHALK